MLHCFFMILEFGAFVVFRGEQEGPDKSHEGGGNPEDEQG